MRSSSIRISLLLYIPNSIFVSAIIIPLPNSPQEDNAAVLAGAAVVLKQPEIASKDLLKEINRLLDDEPTRVVLGENLSKLLRTDVAFEMVEVAEKLM